MSASKRIDLLPKDPPEGKLAWRSAHDLPVANDASSVGFEPKIFTDGPNGWRAEEGLGNGYRLKLVDRARTALATLIEGPHGEVRLWVVDEGFNAPLLVTAGPGPLEGEAVALVCPENHDQSVTDAEYEGSLTEEMVCNRSETWGVASWPVWFHAPPGGGSE